jgi:hypothetical protein
MLDADITCRRFGGIVTVMVGVVAFLVLQRWLGMAG